ncbi:MAG: hypothetical protein R3F56_13860 [Planctomycetota bacterium]
MKTKPSLSSESNLRARVRGLRRLAAVALMPMALAAGAQPLTAQEPQPEAPPEQEVDVPVIEVEAAPDQMPQDDSRVRRLTRRRSPVADGERRSRFGGGFGYGRFRINARELGGRDTEDAAVFRLDGEFWVNRHIGFGLMSELVSTGDDLFEGQQVESGVGLRAADAQITSSDFAAFFAWDPIGADRVRLPLQIGPWFAGSTFDYDTARIDYTFATAGFRVAARPEFKLVDGDKVDFTAFAGASYSLGFTSIYEDLVGPNETYESDAWQFRAEGGLRLDLRRVSLGLQYVFSDMNIDRSDPEGGRRVPEIDFDTHMFFFTIAGRF